MIEIELFYDNDCYFVIVWYDEEVMYKHTFVDRESAEQCYIHYCKMYPLSRKVGLLEDD